MILLKARGKRKPIELVRFTPDGRALLTSSSDGTFLWKNLPSADARQGFLGFRGVRHVRFTPNGRHLFARRGPLVLADLSDGASRQVELWGAGDAYFDLTPDGRHLLVAENNYNNGGPAGWIACCPVNNPSPKAAVWSRTLPQRIRDHPMCVSGERFVLEEPGRDETAGRWAVRYVTRSLQTGEILTSVVGPSRWSSCVVAPDGRLIAGLDHSRVLVLSADDLSEPLATLRNVGKHFFTGPAFHPSGKYLATTSNDETVKVYDTTTWEVARTFTWQIGKMRSIAFSPDGALAAAGGEKGQAVVWDVDL